MIFQLFSDGELVVKGCDSLEEAMLYAADEIESGRKCRIQTMGMGVDTLMSTQAWRYDFEVRAWVKTDPE